MPQNQKRNVMRLIVYHEKRTSLFSKIVNILGIVNILRQSWGQFLRRIWGHRSNFSLESWKRRTGISNANSITSITFNNYNYKKLLISYNFFFFWHIRYPAHPSLPPILFVDSKLFYESFQCGGGGGSRFYFTSKMFFLVLSITSKLYLEQHS